MGFVHLLVRRHAGVRSAVRLPISQAAVAALISFCDRSDCQGPFCSHSLRVLLVVSVHLPAGRDDTHFKGRLNRLAAILRDVHQALPKRSQQPHATVVLGDFNIREEEEQNIQNVIGDYNQAKSAIHCARYDGTSWNPGQNRYRMDAPRCPGFCFDRIFFHGNVHACAYLAGHARFYSGTSKFCLSDHYALRCFLGFGVEERLHDEPHRADRIRCQLNHAMMKSSQEELSCLNVLRETARQSFQHSLAKIKHAEDVALVERSSWSYTCSES